MKTCYPIIANCNFESRDDECGQAIHAARKALESGLTDDDNLIEAMEALEETLLRLDEKDDFGSAEECRSAEYAVADVFYSRISA